MEKKASSGIMLTLLLTSVLSVAFHVAPASAESEITIYYFEMKVIPEYPTTHDEVAVTVYFELPSTGYDVESRRVCTFAAHIWIFPPTGYVVPIIVPYSVRYYIGKLPAGSYQYTVMLLAGRKLNGLWEGVIIDVKTISFTVAPAAISASVDMDPNTLNLKSKGNWITAYMELPTGYDVKNIDVSSISLNGILSVDTDAPTEIGDYDMDGISDLMVKFNRTELESYIYNVLSIKYGEVTLTITGQLYDGTPLIGSDTIFVNYAGDANNDGTINILDAAMISAHWYPGPPTGPLGYNPNADLNLDLRVNIADGGILSVNWGQTIPYTIP